MTRLAFLHEPGVLWNLNTRFLEDHIYTYTGSILIAVNPFASKQHLYQPAVMQQYQAAEFGSLPPHVYAVASAAYSQMQRDNKGQAILVGFEGAAVDFLVRDWKQLAAAAAAAVAAGSLT